MSNTKNELLVTMRSRLVAVLSAHLVDAMARETSDSPTYWPPKSRANPANRARRRLHEDLSRSRLVAYLVATTRASGRLAELLPRKP
jgi:hypothetical protein